MLFALLAVALAACSSSPAGDHPGDGDSAWLKKRIENDQPALKDPRLTDWEKAGLVREWTYGVVDLADDIQTLLPFADRFWLESPESVIAALDNDEGGLWCSGTAWVMAQVLEELGISEPILLHYGFLESQLLTHSVVLAPVTHDGRQVLSIHDPYFNLAFEDAEGGPLDIFDFLTMLRDRDHSRYRIRDESGTKLKDVVIASPEQRYTLKAGKVRAFSRAHTDTFCRSVRDGVHVCRLTPNLSDFIDRHELVEPSLAELERRGQTREIVNLFLFSFAITTDGGYITKNEPGEFFCRVSMILGEPGAEVCEEMMETTASTKRSTS